MKELTMKLVWTLLALVLSSAVSAQPSTLKIGVEGAYPPFSEIGTDGKLKGFDIDIANAICERMKVTCTMVQAEFDALIPALRAKKIDAIVASMSITPERKKSVDFSDKYYQTPARVIAKVTTQDSAKLDVSPEGLKGKKIGVQRTTIHDRFATATFKGATIVRYAKQDEVFLELASNRIDATLMDSVAADVGFLKTPAGKGYAFVGPVYTDPAFFGDGAGIAVRKGDDVLRKKINDAIAAMRADGSYDKLQKKYFDFDVYGATPKK
jgi:arginine/ornithine transport system substrate-binding protein